jgi:hypothetical protein
MHGIVREICEIQSNPVISNSVLTNTRLQQTDFKDKLVIFTQINPVITNNNGRSQAVRYNRVGLYSTFFPISHCMEI